MAPMNAPDLTQTILVVDDESEFRDIAVRLIEPHLPEDWKIEAPSTLDEAMDMIRNRVIRLIFLDRNLSSEGYQPLAEGSRDYESTSGLDIAKWLQNQRPDIRKIAFSKGGLGCAQFNGHVEGKFPLKQYLNFDDNDGETARAVFQALLLEEMKGLK